MNTKIQLKKETFNEIVEAIKNTNNKYCCTSKDGEIIFYQIDNNKLLNKLEQINERNKEEEYPKLVMCADGTFKIKLSNNSELKITQDRELQDFLLNKIKSIQSLNKLNKNDLIKALELL